MLHAGYLCLSTCMWLVCLCVAANASFIHSGPLNKSTLFSTALFICVSKPLARKRTRHCSPVPRLTTQPVIYAWSVKELNEVLIHWGITTSPKRSNHSKENLIFYAMLKACHCLVFHLFSSMNLAVLILIYDALYKEKNGKLACQLIPHISHIKIAYTVYISALLKLKQSNLTTHTSTTLN